MMKVHDNSGAYMYTDVDYVKVFRIIYYKDQNFESDKKMIEN